MCVSRIQAVHSYNSCCVPSLRHLSVELKTFCELQNLDDKFELQNLEDKFKMSYKEMFNWLSVFAIMAVIITTHSITELACPMTLTV